MEKFILFSWVCNADGSIRPNRRRRLRLLRLRRLPIRRLRRLLRHLRTIVSRFSPLFNVDFGATEHNASGVCRLRI